VPAPHGSVPCGAWPELQCVRADDDADANLRRRAGVAVVERGLAGVFAHHISFDSLCAWRNGMSLTELTPLVRAAPRGHVWPPSVMTSASIAH
jgi:hypothetical protein